jgi:hypothetical protein
VSDGANILDVIKVLALLLSRNTPPWFTRIDSLQNTNSPEVLDRDLEHFETLGSSNEGCFQPGITTLLFLSHTRKLALGAHLRVACRLDGLLLLASFYPITHGFSFHSTEEINTRTINFYLSSAEKINERTIGKVAKCGVWNIGHLFWLAGGKDQVMG